MDDKTDCTQNITRVECQGRKVPGVSEVHSPETSPIEGLEARSIGTLLLIEEYTSLRNEIEKRIEIRQQILALTLLMAGTFLTVGVQSNVPEVVLLFYPIIAMFLGTIWEHNDLRVGQINFYIRTKIEKHMGVFGPGWETFRLQTFLPAERHFRRVRGRQRHTLIPQFGLIVFATRGMLLTTQAMAIIIAAIRYIFELLQQGPITNAMEPRKAGLAIVVVLLFLVDIVVVLYTSYLVQHKRL